MLDALPATRLDAAQHDAMGSLTSRCAPCGGYPGPQWFVVQTHPQAERWAAQNLTSRGYEAFLPLYTVQRRDRAVRSLLHTVELPLFATYLFTRFDAARDPWTPIWHTPGVRCLLTKADRQPNPCPDAAVEALQATQHVRRLPVAAKPHWASGTPCSLAAGPMAGLPAVVLNADGDQVRIGVMFLGQIRQVSVAAECLTSRDCLN